MGIGRTNAGGGTDVSGVTATASDVLIPKLFIDQAGALTEGTMPNNGGSARYISDKNDSLTIQAGYHNGNGSVSISSTEKAKIIAGNIKSGITILGMSGSVVSCNTATGQITPSDSSGAIQLPKPTGWTNTSTIVSLYMYMSSFNNYASNRIGVVTGSNTSGLRYYITGALGTGMLSSSVTLRKNSSTKAPEIYFSGAPYFQDTAYSYVLVWY